MAWTGLWTALLALTCSLVNLEFTLEKHAADPDYAAKQTMVSPFNGHAGELQQGSKLPGQPCHIASLLTLNSCGPAARLLQLYSRLTTAEHALSCIPAATTTLCALLLLQGVLYVVLSAAVVGAAMLWARVLFLKRTSTVLTASFEQRKQTALASYNGADVKARAAGASIVTMLGELKGVYRYKDARQISLLCRDMRKWDEDGIPDPDACEYGEFVLKVGGIEVYLLEWTCTPSSWIRPWLQVPGSWLATHCIICVQAGHMHLLPMVFLQSGMARMPNNPALLVSYASFLIEVRKDGQGARTQLQLAQKANPSWLDNLSIYVAQQLAKQLKRGKSPPRIDLVPQRPAS